MQKDRRWNHAKYEGKSPSNGRWPRHSCRNSVARDGRVFCLEGATKPAPANPIDVGLCVWRIRPRGIFFALGGFPELVGHSGATGAFAYHTAEHDAVIVGTFNQTTWQEDHLEFLLRDVLPVLARARRSLAISRSLHSDHTSTPKRCCASTV